MKSKNVDKYMKSFEFSYQISQGDKKLQWPRAKEVGNEIDLMSRVNMLWDSNVQFLTK